MSRVSDFSVGRQWYCDRTKSGNPLQLPPFTFIILGTGPRDYHSFCYTWVAPKYRSQDESSAEHTERTHNQCAWFDHQHLMRHGHLLDPLLDPLGFDVGGVHYTAKIHSVENTTQFSLYAGDSLMEEGSFDFRFPEGHLLPDKTRGKLNEVEALQKWLQHLLGEPVQLPVLQDDFVAGPR